MTSGSAHLVSPPCHLENVSFPNGHWRLSLRPPAEVKAGPVFGDRTATLIYNVLPLPGPRSDKG